jgi:hypothetical protein
MHPELLSALAFEHRRVLAARASGCRAAPACRAPRVLTRPRPRLCISWSRATLAAAAGQGRGRSWVIIISATRSL